MRNKGREDVRNPHNSAWWWEELRDIMQHINANPVIIATYPCLEPVVGYLRDLCFSLSAKEAALAESERLREKAEAEREHFWEMYEGARERSERAEEELAACRLDRDKLEEYWEKRAGG